MCARHFPPNGVASLEKFTRAASAKSISKRAISAVAAPPRSVKVAPRLEGRRKGCEGRGTVAARSAHAGGVRPSGVGMRGSRARTVFPVRGPRDSPGTAEEPGAGRDWPARGRGSAEADAPGITRHCITRKGTQASAFMNGAVPLPATVLDGAGKPGWSRLHS